MDIDPRNGKGWTARANAESCAVTAATPAKTTPTEPTLTPKSSAEENGRGSACETRFWTSCCALSGLLLISRMLGTSKCLSI